MVSFRFVSSCVERSLGSQTVSHFGRWARKCERASPTAVAKNIAKAERGASEGTWSLSSENVLGCCGAAECFSACRWWLSHRTLLCNSRTTRDSHTAVRKSALSECGYYYNSNLVLYSPTRISPLVCLSSCLTSLTRVHKWWYQSDRSSPPDPREICFEGLGRRRCPATH